MRFFFLSLIIPYLCSGQDYKVDTLIKESQQHPGIFDTVIVYRKVNIVREEYVIKEKKAHTPHFPLYVGLSAAYRWALPAKNENTTLHANAWSGDLFAETQINKFVFRIAGGFVREKHSSGNLHLVSQHETFQYITPDTVDTYFVSDEYGVQTPHYVIKDQVVTVLRMYDDVVWRHYTQNFLFLQTEFQIGYIIERKNWLLSGTVGYLLKAALEVSGKQLINNQEYPLQKRHMPALIHGVSINCRAACSLTHGISMFGEAAYIQQLTPVSMTNDIHVRYLSARIGLALSVR